MRMKREEKMGRNNIDYLTLKAESASWTELFLFTVSSKFVDITKLVDCPAAKQTSYTTFGYRWIIVHSIILHKILLLIANTLKFFKTMREKIWGASQQTYAPSKVICRDWRIEVGKKNSKLGDDNEFTYYSALTIMASALAYELPSLIQTVINNCWKMELLKCYEFWNDFQGKPTTQAFMFQNTTKDPNVIVVAFRGSSELGDWLVDFNVSWYNIEGIGHIHDGFMQALGLQQDTDWPKELPPRPDNHQFAYYTLRQALRDIAKHNDNARFIITGHSLGGALATLFVTILAFHSEFALLKKLHAVYTFGQPRVGDRDFAQFMNNIRKKYGFQYYRCVYSFDMVPRVPFDFNDSWYKHFGGCVYYNSCYKGKFLEVEPNKNYFFEILMIPPKYLTSLWELLRSIVIPLFKGPDYFEGFKSLTKRLFGLLLPGASAHMTRNYINSIRYGKIIQPPNIISN